MICTQLKKIVKIHIFQTSSSLSELGPAQPQLVCILIFFNLKFVSLYLTSETRSLILSICSLLTLLPSSAPSPNPNLGAEVILFPDYPTTWPEPGPQPSGIVLFINFQAKLRKQKLLVYMRRLQNSF